MSETEHDHEVLGRAYDGRLMARLWAVTRPHRRLMLLSMALFPLAAAAELVQPYLVKVAIDDHILKRDWAGLGRMALLFLLTLVALYLLRAAQSYVTQITGQRVMHDLREALFVHLQRMHAGYFDRNPVGRLMTRVLNDVEAINELFTSGVAAVVGDVVMLAGVVVILLSMNWRLALVTFALVPVLVLAAGYFRVKARESYRLVRTRLARLNAFLQESLQGITVIQLFAREREEARLFGELNGDLRHAQFRSTLFEASLYAGVEALGSIAVALLLWYGGGQVMTGALTFGGLVAFLEYTGRFFLPIRDLGAKYTIMQSAMASSERIFGLLDVTRRLLVQGPSQHLESLGDNRVAVQRKRECSGRSRRRHVGRVQGPLRMAPSCDVLRRDVQRVSENRIVDDMIVACVADIAIRRHRVGGRTLQVESRLEQRPVHIAHPHPRRIAVQLADSQQELPRQGVIGQLHGGKGPRQSFPLSNR